MKHVIWLQIQANFGILYSRQSSFITVKKSSSILAHINRNFEDVASEAKIFKLDNRTHFV